MNEPAPNARQATYWNEQAGPTWAELQAPLDRQLAPLGARAIAALAPKPGERILDVGCGAGAASLELARAVGPGGGVTGVDISRPLLEVARGRAAGLAGVNFLEADAQTHPFEPASFDAVFSRFGVMFFADPPAAFANIRRALKPGGRLAFVCWREPALNPVMTLAMSAALAHVEPPPPPEPGAPGPFAFADPEHVRRVLSAGGFTDIALTPFEAKIGSGDLETTVALSLRVGPLGGLLRENPDKRDVVIEAVREAYRPHQGPDGVKLDSATWIVTARAG
jgi:SAM-dependent methyltransferase